MDTVPVFIKGVLGLCGGAAAGEGALLQGGGRFLILLHVFVLLGVYSSLLEGTE